MDKESTELRPTRELFVKYKFHSYWDCDFVPELQVRACVRNVIRGKGKSYKYLTITHLFA